MAKSPDMDASESAEIEDLDIQYAVSEVEEIVDALEEGDVELTEAKELRDRANSLLDHIETELEVGDGNLERVEHS